MSYTEYREDKDKRERRDVKVEKLKTEGKTTLAFLIEFQEAIATGFGMLFVTIMIWIAVSSDSSNSELFLELEKKEVQIVNLIKQGKNGEAMELVFELKHDSNMSCTECVETQDEMFGLDLEYTYKQYWTYKRKFYKDWIFSGEKPSKLNPNAN